MLCRPIARFACLVFAGFLAGRDLAAAEPIGTAFTYQGHLQNLGQPAQGLYDVRFTLYDRASGGSQIAGPILQDNLAVSDGLLVATLDFGAAAFATHALWLEVAVRPGEATGAFAVLTPRQALRPVPFALQAGASASAAMAATASSAPWSGLSSVPAGFADGVDNDTTYAAGAGLALTGTQFGIASGGVGTAALANGSVTSEKIASGTVAPDRLAVGSFSNVFWKVDGNAGTTSGTHFLGTTDSKPLELRVNSARALRLEPDAVAPNIIGGAANNAVTSSSGAVIGGGKDHRVVDSDLAAIGGGASNTITNANYAVIPGGRSNVVSADSSLAAGLQACATNAGSFVWADAAGFPFGSTTTNQFRARALGGAEFVTAATKDGVLASVRITATGGVAVATLTPMQPALDLAQGFIRVAGASSRTNSPMFIHRVTAANSSENWSVIDHPLCNGDPSALLLVTPNLNPNDSTGTNHVANLTAVGVFYTGDKHPKFTGSLSRRWALFFTEPSAVAFNAAYNVLVIKP